MHRAPAAERNKGPILDVLLKILGPNFSGRILEIASGTGQHVAHFAKTFTKAKFQPTEYDEQELGSITAFIEEEKLTNVLPPIRVDICQPVSQWPGKHEAESYDVIYNSNMVHISPWQTSEGLFEAAGTLLKPNGYLFTYGPYAVNGVLEPESNVRFDQSLKIRDPSWGVRDIKDLAEVASRSGIKLIDMVDMPSNNKTLIWQKTPTSS